MKDREAIEARIALLKGQLSRAEGTPTEVYSRIVGYYRSVRNWNAGKREEYGQRLAYTMPGMAGMPTAAAPPRGAAPAAGEGAPAGSARSEAAAAASPEAAAVAARPAVVDFQGATSLRDSSRVRDSNRVRDGFLVFTRETCPNCPPVANYVVASGMKAVFVDVDREEGFALACDLGVMATPTVLAMDGEGRESFRAFDVATLRTRVAAGLRSRFGERPAAVPPGMA